MFDFHMHSRVSFDGHDTGEALARAAAAKGLKEICFTDHLDYDPLGKMGKLDFDTAAYNAEYDRLANIKFGPDYVPVVNDANARRA